ncbi:GNAT family N-acetyltransferase [Rhizobium oryziradicis]|uniref:GNAT family N-acetyltransferase n=1 Tax=Rhizobium oryziradicis TaxID=1867956 RepID=A0A1Q8ZRA4_9HYPH|nr:GNAT family N-acetyltransferase [Rhizobium oryziradicis]OLP44518.1 GNAT family N-acetyltransferase [Rhizobium oryziradicis]
MKDTPPVIPVAANARWPEGLIIRTIGPEDTEALIAMQSLPGYRFGTLRPPYPTVQGARKYIESLQPNVTSLVAVLNGKIVGNAGMTQLAGRRSHAASIGMGVHDDYQRRGIGRALLGELVAIADDWLNIKRLELTVYTDNTGAIALYESFGFRQEGLHRAFAFRDGCFVDAYAMARIRL